MQQKHYNIRTMTREEVTLAIEWAAQEGWNPGLHDAACYYEADPDGFLMGLLDGEPIACISAIRYAGSFGFVGFYIVKPQYRGQGYGIQLWNAALDYLKGRNIGLDGVLAQQDNYMKSGFKLAYRNIRYEGLGGGSQPENPEIIPLDRLAFDALAAYERPFFPTERPEFIKAWINQPGCHALGIMRNGTLSGYGVIRPCRKGYKIGPLFADSQELAESLFQALKAKVEASDAIYLDISELNPAAVELAERHKMQLVFETSRMYTRETPELPLDKIFGITSFEIG
ncbi:GNAT family N-acetyltransferase [Shewanella sp. AS16]|uniref:GNAT family N-acetyltransferase n=1 Tax=Shewanella sp. AS16 TaxID=2907625 RepID=UPI001F259F95|nr:GNAT family N-acetyltransferase [Shewanella sp. AS16]MCE9686639.1 GNAT family N-acetyltransferase [Shewanella sp. AS16]